MKARVNYLLLAPALLGTFFSGTATRIVSISMPTIASNLATDLLGVSWALLSYQLSNIGLSIVFGRLSDLWGRTTAHHVGFIIGPSIGGLMIDYLSWRYSFFFLVPIGICGTLLSLLNLKRRALNSQRRAVSIDYLGAALLFATTSALVMLLDRRTQQMMAVSSKAALAVLFCLCLIGLIVHETRTKTPILNLWLFKIRQFSMSVISLLVVASCYALTGFLLPFYLQDVLGLTPTHVGLLFMAPSVITVALAPASGYLADRAGPRIPASIGVAFMIFSLGIRGFFRIDSHWILPALLIIVGAITNGIFNPANSMAMIAMMPTEHRGFASAVNHVTLVWGMSWAWR
jgi:MFS family permease